MRAIARPRPRR